MDQSSSGNRKMIFFWPLACLIASVLLWLFVNGKIGSEKIAIERRAMQDATALSRVYASYLARSLEQMDQITMHVKSDWERLGRNLRLEELKRDGLFTSADFAAVTIFDNKGRPVTSTVPVHALANINGSEHFLFHQSNNSTALRISQPVISQDNGKNIIYLTRRLDAADDAFDGIVLIAVDSAYFLKFYDRSIFGDAGLLAVTGDDGQLRSSTIGGTSYRADSPAIRKLQALLRTDGGYLAIDNTTFADGQTRYIGWQDVKSYPLTVIVGLSHRELFAPHESAWGTYREFAWAGTAFLIVFAIAGIFFGMHLANRERQALAIRKTYRVATESANEGFYIMHPLHNGDGDIVDWKLADSNETGAALYGVERGGFIGTRLSQIYPGPLFQSTMDVFRVALASGSYEDEYRVPEDSPLRAKWLHRRIVTAAIGLAVTVRDISESKKTEQELLRLANEDALTELPNRHWLMRYLPLALQRAEQNNGKLGVLFLDLDEFKNINDTLGHSAGDELLQITAQRVKAVLRPNDRMVRLGGDEFTVIVEQVQNKSDTAHVAERIISALRHPTDIAGVNLSIGVSIGISLFPDDGIDPEVLLKNADIAMYAAKANGKDHYRYFEPHLYEALKQRLNCKQALRRAIEEDHFILHYQPRVHTDSGELCGIEALVRWIDPERGMVPPLEFIPLAESSGLILQLGELVIEKACRQIAQWKDAGLPLVPVSVNVSPRQFNAGEVKAQLALHIARHGISPRDIQVEITESAMMGEQAEITAELSAIQAQGIKLLVDDFGTGYSSLSQLQRLDFDALKVDRAFTAELSQSEQGQVFFKAIVSMAHALGMKVTAEGVENVQQLAILHALECDEVQGYFISRPVSAADMAGLLHKRFMLGPVDVQFETTNRPYALQV